MPFRSKPLPNEEIVWEFLWEQDQSEFIAYDYSVRRTMFGYVPHYAGRPFGSAFSDMHKAVRHCLGVCSDYAFTRKCHKRDSDAHVEWIQKRLATERAAVRSAEIQAETATARNSP
jgi:hypothetical protein